MSGGVDSSVAAALLVERGHEVVGVTLRVWPWEESDRSRPPLRQLLLLRGDGRGPPGRSAPRDPALPAQCRGRVRPRRDRAVRRRLPDRENSCSLRVVQQGSKVRLPAPPGAGVGRRRGGHRPLRAHHPWTPRPAATCSGVAAMRARTSRTFSGRSSQEQLAAARFPVGDLTKDEVREHARRLGLATAEAPESQELCFIPDHDYRGFLRRRQPDVFQAGPIVDDDGRVIGTHAGVANYTIGQRKGLGLAERRAPLRGRSRPRHGDGARRAGGGPGAHATARDDGQLHRLRAARGPARRDGEDPPQPRAGARHGPHGRRRNGRGRCSRSPSAPSPRASPSCGTRAIAWWAAASSCASRGHPGAVDFASGRVILFTNLVLD